jgi:tetratricopeptide (TPR) repeat protein
MALYRDCLALAPDFTLDGPDEWSALLAHADASGQSQLAVSLAEGFLARFPRDRDRQATALVAARLMAGRLGREDEARALLDRMISEAPDHPLAADLAAAKLALGRVA